MSVVDTLYVIGNLGLHLHYQMHISIFRRSSKPERIREHQSEACGEADCGSGQGLGAAAGPAQEEASQMLGTALQ